MDRMFLHDGPEEEEEEDEGFFMTHSLERKEQTRSFSHCSPLADAGSILLPINMCIFKQ